MFCPIPIPHSVNNQISLLLRCSLPHLSRLSIFSSLSLSLMDSGNSGSMQSSSTAGDEDSYDSRADNSSISAFLLSNNNPTPPPLSFTAQQHHMFDPLSNYLDPAQRSPSNLDMMWSKISRSEPNQSDLAAFVSSSQQNQPFLLSQLGGGSQGGVGVSGSAFHTAHHSLPQETVSSRGGSLSVSAANDNNSNSNNNNNNNNNNNMVRNPKKRSRASRRAPTTVLTTDTNNFRAMVQEFTGIPAPPFTSFPRTRLDLFGSSSSSSPTIRSTSSHLDPPIRTPPYLLRPFAHKPQPSPIPSPSSLPSMVDTSTSNNSSNSNYHLNMHNPILSFLHPPLNPKYSPVLVASKTQQQQQQPSLEIPPNSVVDSHLRMGGGVLEELGLNHPHVGNMVQSSSDGALMARVNNNNMRNPSVDWAQRIGNNSNDGGGVLRSLSGTINYRSNATPSDLHGEKGPDCAVAARSQGMVESWINCSSDT